MKLIHCAHWTHFITIIQLPRRHNHHIFIYSCVICVVFCMTITRWVITVTLWLYFLLCIFNAQCSMSKRCWFRAMFILSLFCIFGSVHCILYVPCTYTCIIFIVWNIFNKFVRVNWEWNISLWWWWWWHTALFKRRTHNTCFAFFSSFDLNTFVMLIWFKLLRSPRSVYISLSNQVQILEINRKGE